jgi:arylsulfatase
LLKDEAGYNTIVSGKWHVGLQQSALAYNRGFDRSFTMLNNGSSYFNSAPLYNDGSKITFMLNDQEIARSDTSKYLTQAITDFAIKSLNEIKEEQKPFFMYVAYNAPHWPIQALPEDIAKYKGKYLKGWDVLRKQRYEKQLAAGIIKKQWQLSARDSRAPAWDSLSPEEKDKWDTRMAIYAAMVSRMDACIGEIMTRLKQLGKDKNTIILFASDNGGSADEVKSLPTVIQKNGVPGSVNSIDSYEIPWANLSNTPFKLFKRNTHEGGIATPLIAWYPGHVKAGSMSSSPGHLIDLMPTSLDLAGVKYPMQFKNRQLTPLAGISLVNTFKNRPDHATRTLFWEHEGSRAIRKGKWKLVAEPGQQWELYDLNADRSEKNDLSVNLPLLVSQLKYDYLQWAKKVGVVDWNKIAGF